jgi:predicted RNA-binding protein YlqC (UPF0109 family)
MLSAKHQPLRNLIDLADSKQVRTLTKRLGISEDDLRRIIEKSGNSIAAITKEVELERTAARSNSDNS